MTEQQPNGTIEALTPRENRYRDINDKLRQALPVTPVHAAVIGIISTFILFYFVGSILQVLLFGMKIGEIDYSLKLLQVGQQILFILLPALFLSFAFYRDVTEVIRFRWPDIREYLLYLPAVILLSILLNYFLAFQDAMLEVMVGSEGWLRDTKNSLDAFNDQLQAVYADFVGAHNPFEMAFALLVAALTPAICEEVMFRGYFFKSLELRFKPAIAIFISGLVFSLYHFNPYGFLPITGMGIFLAYAVYRSNSIGVSVFIHFLYNGIAILLYNLLRGTALEKQLESPEGAPLQLLPILIGAGVLFAVSVYFIERFYKLQQKGEESHGSMS